MKTCLADVAELRAALIEAVGQLQRLADQQESHDRCILTWGSRDLCPLCRALQRAEEALGDRLTINGFEVYDGPGERIEDDRWAEDEDFPRLNKETS